MCQVNPERINRNNSEDGSRGESEAGAKPTLTEAELLVRLEGSPGARGTGFGGGWGRDPLGEAVGDLVQEFGRGFHQPLPQITAPSRAMRLMEISRVAHLISSSSSMISVSCGSGGMVTPYREAQYLYLVEPPKNPEEG